MRGVPFFFPYIAGTVYTPGVQPNNPGEPTAIWPGHEGLRWVPMPWPGMVATVNAMASHVGIPRGRAPVPVVDRYSPLLMNQLFIAGFAGKSQG